MHAACKDKLQSTPTKAVQISLLRNGERESTGCAEAAEVGQQNSRPAARFGDKSGTCTKGAAVSPATRDQKHASKLNPCIQSSAFRAAIIACPQVVPARRTPPSRDPLSSLFPSICENSPHQRREHERYRQNLARTGAEYAMIVVGEHAPSGHHHAPRAGFNRVSIGR